jgi:hypothetical protein
LVGAAATFQRLIDLVLSGLLYEIVICYIDDATIFSTSTFDDHLNCIEKVFKRFDEANLTLKPSKCNFGMTRTVYLGHVIDTFGESPDPEKIQQIKDRSVPKNVTDIRSFLGLANCYPKCAPNFAEIAKPLTRLTKKNFKFVWSPEHMEAFNKLKNELSKSRVLAHFNYKLKTNLDAMRVMSELGQFWCNYMEIYGG